MVKVFLAIFATMVMIGASAKAEMAELHVSSNCHFCIPAKIIINKLIAEGYDVKIVTDSKERVFPTLIIKVGGRVIKYVGLRTEAFYRHLIPKKGRGVDQPLVMDLPLRK